MRSRQTGGDKDRRVRRRHVAWTAGLSLAVLVPLLLAAGPADAPASANPGIPQNPTWSVVLSNGGYPIAESSPNVATLPGGESVVVGDRAGQVWAYHLADGTAVPGWPAPAGAPVDSTPSVADLGGHGVDDVFVGSGNAANPTNGGYRAISPNGTELWYTPVVDPGSDVQPAYGVQASLTVGILQHLVAVAAGSLDQEQYAINATSGQTLGGWPFFTSDSVFSTAAIGDLYGNGQNEIVAGGDQTAGFADGQNYPQGGHLRILNDRGGLICHYDMDQTVDSSPAIGAFLAGGAVGEVVGTGAYFGGANDTGTVKAFDNTCHLVWTAKLDGSTFSSPALADVLGNGQGQVVEGTDTGSGGSAWILDAATGSVITHIALPNGDRVIGSVVAADLFGQGYDDLLVPTVHGVLVYDARSAQLVDQIDSANGFQNSPLVTDDPNGTVGITVAGYNGNNQGLIDHYEIAGSDGAAAVGPGSWPMFHHDPQLTGDAGLGADPTAPCQIPAAALDGYQLVAADGGIFSYGQPFCGSTGNLTLNAPIVAAAQAPAVGGYWLVARDGGVFAFGNVGYYGSMGGQPLNQPIVGMAATPDGKGYWLVAADGGIFAFGDARYWGSTGGMHLNAPIVGIQASPDGAGYRLVASDGGIFTFGDAQYFGSMGGQPLAAPVVGITGDGGAGYWLVARDGGIFAFGGAKFFGSMGGQPLAAPIVGMTATADGQGYRFVASDGGLFAFGDASFAGSMGGQPLNQPVVGMVGF
ncbi:MAG TPA: hypothetical protein VKG43_10805 [Acidimicrobiales bacterium]|nr:hypothetical protein [Acidimicrobiales bacterium]